MRFVLFFTFLVSGVCGGCAPAPVGSLKARTAALAELESELSSQADDELRQRIAAALSAGLAERQLSSSENAAWQILHGVACYGPQLKLVTPDRGEVGALDYAFTGGQINGLEMMSSGQILPATGRLGMKAKLEPGSYIGQGHVDQWIAIFAMADLPLDTKIVLGEQQFTLEDWVRQAQRDVTLNMLDEYAWTLIAMTHYLPDESSWQAENGDTISWEDLLAVELDQELSEAACGGTHRLSGIVRALDAKQRLGLPDSAVWTRARELIDECIANARQNRGADGKLSCYYFQRPGGSVDVTAELSSSGHVFEFLALALPAEELADPWVELSAQRLCELLELSQSADLDCGALYHALNGLKIYQQRRID